MARFWRVGGDFAPKAEPQSIYVLWIFPIQTIVENIKNYNKKTSCNYENTNKLFYQEK